MPNFKPGDRVRVREWDDMEKEFGLTNNGNIRVNGIFLQTMSYLCGQTATVQSIYGCGNQRFTLLWDTPDEKRTQWIFSEDMFEFADTELTIDEVSDLEFTSILGGAI